MYIEKLQTVILCNSGSKKQFWNTVKYLRKEQLINNQQLDGKCADNELDKANMLKDYISTHFSVSLPPPSGPFVSAEHLDLLGGMLENLLCTEEDVMSPLQ